MMMAMVMAIELLAVAVALMVMLSAMRMLMLRTFILLVPIRVMLIGDQTMVARLLLTIAMLMGIEVAMTG